MVSYNIFVACTLLIVVASTVLAYDPDLLQDFCVADLTANESVNGFPCKNRTTVTADDFFFAVGFDRPGNTSNALGFAVTPATVLEFPGLNTLGISMVRIDFAPNGGLNPLHTHP
ncbi:Germin-like protein 1-1 [Ranunculus cassubicifolius]